MPSELPSDLDCHAGARDWPHAPPHHLAEAGVYFVTARCRDRFSHFDSDMRRDYLTERLHALTVHYGWTLEAWAVLSNHYHFVAQSPAKADLPKLLRHLHGDTARYVNLLDTKPGRSIWQNYRETHLTLPRAYLARLNYVHQNAVHHGLVAVATEYRWCSAAAFEQAVSPAWAKTISRFRYEQIATEDGE